MVPFFVDKLSKCFLSEKASHQYLYYPPIKNFPKKGNVEKKKKGNMEK
jgi:hypothetical protein